MGIPKACILSLIRTPFGGSIKVLRKRAFCLLILPAAKKDHERSANAFF